MEGNGSARLARLEKNQDEMIRYQSDHGEKLTRILTIMEQNSDLPDRVSALEALRNRIYGYLFGASVAGAGGGLGLAKWFGVGGFH